MKKILDMMQLIHFMLTTFTTCSVKILEKIISTFCFLASRNNLYFQWVVTGTFSRTKGALTPVFSN